MQSYIPGDKPNVSGEDGVQMGKLDNDDEGNKVEQLHAALTTVQILLYKL